MCGKIKLDKISAQLIVAKSQRSRKNKRKECRIYFCPDCKTWHTTSSKTKVKKKVNKW